MWSNWSLTKLDICQIGHLQKWTFANLDTLQIGHIQGVGHFGHDIGHFGP